MTGGWRRRILVVVAAASCVCASGLAVLLAADVYVHQRVQNLGGVNVWGYRGPVVGRKRAGETRLVVLGGSTAFGYGVPYDEAFPFYLEQKLNRSAVDGRRYSVVNLGAPSQGAYGFRFDLQDYSYLAYDAVILYEGYNDLGMHGVPSAVPPRNTPNYSLWRRQSPLFRMAGYFPILPLALREKAMQLTAGGDLDAAYRGKVTFKPGLATRVTASTLRSAAVVADQVGFQIGTFSGQVPSTAPSPEDVETWRHYTTSVLDAVSFARQRGVKVAVVTQPYASDTHVLQQQALAAALRSAFGADSLVRYVNLGTAIDVRDRTLAYDGLHLVAEGNERIAEQLLPPVRDLLGR
jgi:lysophospholipase L1-like esterase